MKLYTEEQVREALWKTEHPFSDGKNVDEIMKSQTPIELPSDEEIEEYADNVMPYAEKIGGKTYTAYITNIAIQLGAKWMRNKIQGGNNEQ